MKALHRYEIFSNDQVIVLSKITLDFVAYQYEFLHFLIYNDQIEFESLCKMIVSLL